MVGAFEFVVVFAISKQTIFYTVAINEETFKIIYSSILSIKLFNVGNLGIIRALTKGNRMILYPGIKLTMTLRAVL